MNGIHRLLDRAGSRPVFFAAVAVMVALGAYLRFSDLTVRELWFDESCTLYYVQHLHDWPADVDPQAQEITSYPYVWLLRGWTRLAGETPWGLRSFSAVAGCATILVLAAAGRRMGGPFVGFAAALLVAVHPLHIHYSQEARVYALWMLETALLVWLVYEAGRSRSLWWWRACLVVELVIIVTHYHSFFWVPFVFVGVLAGGDARRQLDGWFKSHMVFLLSTMPLIYLLLLHPLRGRGSLEWLRETWWDTPPLLAIPKSLWAMLPSGGYPKYVGVLADAAAAAGQWAEGMSLLMRWLPAVMVGALASLVVLRREPAVHGDAEPAPSVEHAQRGTLGYLAAFTLVVLGAPFLYSLVAGPAYVVGRYDVAALPAVVLAVAIVVPLGVRRVIACPVRGRVYSMVAVVVLAGCGLITSAAARTVPLRTDLAERAARLEDIVGKDEIVVTLSTYRWHLYYELQRQGFAGTLRSYPAAHDRQIGWANAEAELRDPARLDADAAEIVTAIAARMSADGRTWILLQDAEGARREVDMRLFEALHRAGYAIEPVDEWLGLGEIRK